MKGALADMQAKCSAVSPSGVYDKRKQRPAVGGAAGLSEKNEKQILVGSPLTTSGACLHSARTAPIIALFIPGTPLHTNPLQKKRA